MNKNIKVDKMYTNKDFFNWKKRWKERLKKYNNSTEKSLKLMFSVNPLIIPRNHKVEESLYAAVEHNNMKPFSHLLEILSHPFDEVQGSEEYSRPGPQLATPYQTFCGT